MEILVLIALIIILWFALGYVVARTFGRACQPPPLPVLPPVDFNHDKLQIKIDTLRAELLLALEALEHYADYDHGAPARIVLDQIRDPLFRVTGYEERT